MDVNTDDMNAGLDANIVYPIEVSVILATHNRLPLLQQALTTLFAQTFSPQHFEIVIVNDGSRDGTMEWLDALQAPSGGPAVRIAHHPLAQGPCKTWNAAIAMAGGRYIAITDDDCRQEPDWLAELYAEMQRGHCGGVGGRIISSGDRSLISRYCDYIAYNVQAQPGETTLHFVNTANGLFPSAVLREAEGFDESFPHLGSLDQQLCRRIAAHGYTFRACPTAVVYHWNKSSFRILHRAFFRQAIGKAYMHALEHPGDTIAFIVQYTLKLVFNLLRFLLEMPVRMLLNLVTRRLPWPDAVCFPFLDRTTKICGMCGRIIGRWRYLTPSGTHTSRSARKLLWLLAGLCILMAMIILLANFASPE